MRNSVSYFTVPKERGVSPALDLDGSELPALLTGIEKARDSFGSPVWRAGLERMREVREATSLNRGSALSRIFR